MEEIWKDIIIQKNGIIYDYSGLYQVSNLGRVRSLDRVDSNGHKVKGKIMQYKPRKNGYVYATLCKDGKKQQQFLVHRLVATMFIPNPDNLPQVNHKNELKHDNVWTNLEWCTESYNANYGTRNERAGEKKKGEKNPMYGRTGDKNPFYGKHHTEELKQRHSEKMKGKYTGAKNPKAHKVICIETKQIFGCTKDASEWCHGNVSMCCRGVNKTAGGYHWMYLEDYLAQQEVNVESFN